MAGFVMFHIFINVFCSKKVFSRLCYRFFQVESGAERLLSGARDDYYANALVRRGFVQILTQKLHHLLRNGVASLRAVQNYSGDVVIYLVKQ
jgi:hypothetical protein